jgi:hypothetical protein
VKPPSQFSTKPFPEPCVDRQVLNDVTAPEVMIVGHVVNISMILVPYDIRFRISGLLVSWSLGLLVGLEAKANYRPAAKYSKALQS